MDTRDLVGVTRGGGGNGSGSDSGGNGGRSVYTSSPLRRLTLSSSTSTHLMSEFNTADGAEGSGSGSPSSSSSPGELDLGPGESHCRRRRVDPEASPKPNHVGLLLLLSPVGSSSPTDDDVLIMDGVLVDNNGSRSSTPSGARGSTSLAAINGPGNRRSVSLSDLVLVSSRSSGSSSGDDQERGEPRRTQPTRQGHAEGGSSSSWAAQDTGYPNYNMLRGYGYPYPYPPMEYYYPPPLAGPPLPPGIAGAYYPYQQLQSYYCTPPPPPPPPPPSFTPPVTVVNAIWPPEPYHSYNPRPRVTIRRPPGWSAEESAAAPGQRPRVTITRPPGWSAEEPAAAAPGQRPRVTITAPPGGRAPAAGPSSAPEQPAMTQPPTLPPLFSPEEEAAINKKLYGPRTGRRLPVFEDICPSDAPSPAPSPPPPPPPPPAVGR